MPEDVLFKTAADHPRAVIADRLRAAASQIEAGTVELADDTATREITIPETPRFEVELERLTDSETGEERYELEYEVRWTR